MQDNFIMTCGHSSNAIMTHKNGTQEPCCAICGNTKRMEIQPVLTARKAKCSYGCKASICESNSNLAFFSSKPGYDFDEYYCGCHGWD